MIHLSIALNALLLLVQEPKKLPVPDPTAHKAAVKLVRDIFKDDYAKVRPEDRIVLAIRLFQQARQLQDDPTSRYVMIHEAYGLATHSGDFSLALQSADELGKHYQVDVPALKYSALAAAERMDKEPKRLAAAYLKLADEAVLVERFDLAEKAAAAVSAIGKKAKDLPLISRGDMKLKEAISFRTRKEKLEKARELLESNPDDPAANLLVGQHESFIKANWATGLQLLAKGSDPALSAQARMDLAVPADSTAQMTAGDGWWGLAEKETGTPRDNLRSRAAHWYEKAVSGLSGLALAKVEKRLSEFSTERLMRGSWLDITDPTFIKAIPKKGEALVLDGKADQEGIELSTLPPPGQFDGFSVRLRFVGERKGQARIRFEGQRRLVWVSGHGSRFSSIFRAPDGKWVSDYDKDCPLRDEDVVTALLGDGEWMVYLNGKETARLKTNATDLKTLGLIAFQNKVAFDRILLRRKE